MIKADEVLYADFECLLLENEDGTTDTGCGIIDEPKKKEKRQKIFQDFHKKNRMWVRMLLRNFLTT
jgi:hypothetical protein